MMWGKPAFFMLLERYFGGFLKNAYLYGEMVSSIQLVCLTLL